MERAPYVSLLFFAAAAGVFSFGLRSPSGEKTYADESGVAEKSAPAGEAGRRARVASFARSWPKAPDYKVGFVALDGTNGAAAVASDDAHITRAMFDPDDDYYGLPAGEDEETRDLVSAYCAPCHSLQIVMQQRATRARWDYLLTWMTEEQNMAALSPTDEAAVLDYLTHHFGPDGG
ncbi:MAG: hypothetical protein AAGA09_03665 [Pseudomonadota bacterium]